jgi:hypothetical protein
MINHDDDVLCKGHLNYLINKLDKSPKINVAECSINLINEEGLELNKKRQRIFSDIKKSLTKKRNLICETLKDIGLGPIIPKGSYYVLADVSKINGLTSKEKAMNILQKTKVASVPGFALGATYKGKKVGSFGDFVCFSFHGAKIAVTGEGGMLVTNDKELYKKCKLLVSMGRTDRKAVFWSDSIGVQYTMGNLPASLALAQVERIEELVEKKRDTFFKYKNHLEKIDGIKFIEEREGDRANYCYPSILLEKNLNVDRNHVLKDNNIQARPGFPRMSEFPTLIKYFDNKVAELAEKRGISLPTAANIDDSDIKFVCDIITNLLKS